MAGILLPAGCCCDVPCDHCTGLPRHIEVTVTGVTMCDCVPMPGGGSARVTYAGLNGIYTLTRMSNTPPYNCTWLYRDYDACTVELFNSADCSGDVADSFTLDVLYDYHYNEANPPVSEHHSFIVYALHLGGGPEFLFFASGGPVVPGLCEAITATTNDTSYVVRPMGPCGTETGWGVVANESDGGASFDF